MAAEDDIVLLSVADGVATISFNQPARQNAWTPGMTDRYVATLATCAGDPDVRVIVVTGAGGHWCSGGDGAVLDQIAEGGEPCDVLRPLPYLAMRIAKPVVAAIPGVCFGIGLFHALCCDVRFAAADAKFCTAYARRGLPAEAGISWLLPRAVGRGCAADLLYSARVIRAEEALRIGLVNRLVPAATLLDEAIGYARAIADHCSPASLRMMKRQLHNDDEGSFEAAFGRVEAMLAVATAGDDFREGVESWRQARPPLFAAIAGDDGLL